MKHKRLWFSGIFAALAYLQVAALSRAGFVVDPGGIRAMGLHLRDR